MSGRKCLTLKIRRLQRAIRMLVSEHILLGESGNVPQNGEKNRKFGVYRSLCCGMEIVITEGSKFPDCPNHSKLMTHWKPVADDARPVDLPRAKKKNNDPAA